MKIMDDFILSKFLINHAFVTFVTFSKIHDHKSQQKEEIN
jgi:hypothetical protein